MKKKKFYNEIRYNLKKILEEYINNRPMLEIVAFPAEVVDNGDSALTMTFTKFPRIFAWYFQSDVIRVLLEAMTAFAHRHHCKDIDSDEIWDTFEVTYDFDWDVKMYDNLCDNTLKVIRK